MSLHFTLRNSHFILAGFCIACGGCGLIHQALSPNLHTLVNDYGVVTVPNKDHEITFQDKPINDAEFAKAFKHLKAYGGVKVLVLNGQEVSDVSIPLILQLHKFEILHLQGTKVTIDGFRQLTSLPHLRGLVIEAQRFAPDEVATLREALPRVEIVETWYILDYGWRKPATHPATTRDEAIINSHYLTSAPPAMCAD